MFGKKKKEAAAAAAEAARAEKAHQAAEKKAEREREWDAMHGTGMSLMTFWYNRYDHEFSLTNYRYGERYRGVLARPKGLDSSVEPTLVDGEHEAGFLVWTAHLEDLANASLLVGDGAKILWTDSRRCWAKVPPGGWFEARDAKYPTTFVARVAFVPGKGLVLTERNDDPAPQVDYERLD